MADEANDQRTSLSTRRGRSRGLRLASALGVHDTGRALRDFVTYLPTQAIPALVGFLVLPILARKLLPAELGVLTIAQTLVTLGWTIVASWLAAAVIRELPAHQQRGDAAGFVRTFVRGIAVAALLLLVYSAVLETGAVFSSAVRSNVLLIIAATSGLVIQNIAVSLFAASLKPRLYAVVEVSARVGGAGLGVALVFNGQKVGGYLSGLAIASTVIGLVGLWLAWPRHMKQTALPETPSLRPWLHYGIPASMAAVTVWLLTFVDRYLLAALKDTGATGLYAVGNVLGDKAVAVPTMAFLAAASPLLVTAFEKHGRLEVERLMRAYSRIILIVGLLSVALVAVTARDILHLLTGQIDYSAAAPVAPIVALGSFLLALAFVANTGLVIAKRTWPMIAASAIGLGVNVIANLILIPPFGIIGAAVATPVGNGAYLLASYAFARSHASWSFPVGTLVRVVLAALAAYAVAETISVEVASRAGSVGLALVAGVGTYLIALMLLGERRRGLIRVGRPVGDRPADLL